MATVGDKYYPVESGWRRVEDTITNMGWLGPVVTGNSFSNIRSGTILHLDSTATIPLSRIKAAYIEFRFSGPKLRVGMAQHELYTDKVSIIVDGVETVVSTYNAEISSAAETLLAYENLDLGEGKHTCTIQAQDPENSLNRGLWALDFFDIDENGQTFVARGMNTTSLPATNKYLFNNDHFHPIGSGWSKTSSSLVTNTYNDALEFYVYGSEVLLVGYVSTAHCERCELWVDDVHQYDYSHCHNNSSAVLRIVARWNDDTGKKKIHKVRIVNKQVESTRTSMNLQSMQTDGFMCDWSGRFIDHSWINGYNSIVGGIAWKVSASSVYSTSFPVTNAFNGRSDGQDSWVSAKGVYQNVTVTVNCNVPFPVCAFSISPRIYGANDLLQYPRIFRLDGSNDGTTWATLGRYEIKQWTRSGTQWEEPYYTIFKLDRVANFSRYQFVTEDIFEVPPQVTQVVQINSLRFYVTPEADRYLLKTGAGAFMGFDSTGNFVETQITSLTEDFLSVSKIVSPEDALPVLAGGEYAGSKLVSIRRKKVSIGGTVGDAGVILFGNDYYLARVGSIRRMLASTEIGTGAECAVAVSKDSGTSWLTYSSGQWAPLSIEIPNDLCADTVQTRAACDAILASGVDINDLNTPNWDGLQAEKLLFAIAFKRNAATTPCAVSNINWMYDRVNSLRQITHEMDTRVVGSTVTIKALKPYEVLYVNVSTNGV